MKIMSPLNDDDSDDRMNIISQYHHHHHHCQLKRFKNQFSKGNSKHFDSIMKYDNNNNQINNNSHKIQTKKHRWPLNNFNNNDYKMNKLQTIIIMKFIIILLSICPLNCLVLSSTIQTTTTEMMLWSNSTDNLNLISNETKNFSNIKLKPKALLFNEKLIENITANNQTTNNQTSNNQTNSNMTMMTEIDNSTNHNHNISSSITTRKSCDRLSMKCMNVKIFNQTILPSSSSLNSVQKNKFNKKNDVDDVNDQSAIINMTTTTTTTTTTMMTTSVTKMLSLTDANMMDKLKTDDNNNENVTKKANFIDKDDEPILSSSSSLPSTIKMNDQQQQQKTNISSGLMNQIDEKKVLSSPLPFATSASININKNHHSKPETINDLNKDHLDDNDDDNQRFFACEVSTILINKQTNKPIHRMYKRNQIE